MDWYYILVIVFAVAIVLFVPVLVWMAVISGLYQVACDRLRRRAAARQRKAGKLVEEPVVREVT
jgi:hypothetical protein